MRSTVAVAINGGIWLVPDDTRGTVALLEGMVYRKKDPIGPGLPNARPCVGAPQPAQE